MFKQSFRKCAILALFGIGLKSYSQAGQPNLGDLNLTAESQVIYYPTESGINQIYWSDLSAIVEDLNISGDPSLWNEDTKYLIKKTFLKNQLPNAFETLKAYDYPGNEGIIEKRNRIIKAIYSEEWWNMYQEASGDGQTKAWQDFFVDTEKYDIQHHSVFATSVFDITSDQKYKVRPYTTGWIYIHQTGWIYGNETTFPYFYDPTTRQWMQFLQMEERYGFLHPQTMLLVDVNSFSIFPISPFWDADYYDSNLTLEKLNNPEVNPLVDIPNLIPQNYYLGIAIGDFSSKPSLLEWVDTFSGKFSKLAERSVLYNSKLAERSVLYNFYDQDVQQKDKEKDSGGEAVALDQAGLIDLDNSEKWAKAETYVEVTEKASELYADKKEADATAARRRANNGESTADSFDQLKLDAIDFVKTFAVNDALQNPNDYDWGDVFDISDDMETYILSIKDGILQAESDEYQVLTYDGFMSNLVEGTRIGHFRASISDDAYYNFIKAVLSQDFPPDDARLNLVTQNENNESRYEFYFHKDNLEVFKSLIDLTCDKPYTNGWYYTPKDGWLWTTEEFFPFIYSASKSGWLYFQSRNMKLRFYDYKTKSWGTLE